MMAEPPANEKEMRIEQSIDQNHDQPCVQHGQSKDDKERIDKDHPRKERQPPQRHVRCALQRTVAMKLISAPTEPMPRTRSESAQ